MYIRADKYNSKNKQIGVVYLVNAFNQYRHESFISGYWVYAHWIDSPDRHSAKTGIYFGRTKNIDTRWGNHVYDSIRKAKDKYFPFQMAIDKHGPSSFHHACIPALSWEHAGEVEKECVALAREDSTLDVYNVADGGRGIQLSPEIIAKRVITFKKTVATPESKERRRISRENSINKRKLSGKCGAKDRKIGPWYPGRKVLDHIAKTIERADYKEMVELAKSGVAVSKLAVIFKISQDTVKRRLTWTNVYIVQAPRPNSKSSTSINRPPPFDSIAYRQKIKETEEFKIVLNLYEKGCSYAKISKQTGIHADKVRNWVRWIYPGKLTRVANTVPRTNKKNTP